MIDLLLPLVYFTIAPYIVGACILRLNVFNMREHKYSWAIMYILFATFACGEMLDVLVSSQWPSEGRIAGLFAIAANLHLTRASWRTSPPSIVERRHK